MAVAPTAKGTVTCLSSIFSAEDVQKASDRVQDAIRNIQKEIDQLNGFISENNDLISLVARLPDELHHDIMVPFGKSAFFPGSLIHTNELLVLLGESYYADRTSKQTIEILKRRGKTLEHNVDSLKSTIKDLNAEASFFDSTALEAAEGLVEIREELTEEDYRKSILGSAEQVSPLSKVDSEVGDEDEDYALVMSRLDELEREEMEADGISENHEDEEIVEDHKILNTGHLLDKNLHISEELEAESSMIQSQNKDVKCQNDTDSKQKVFEVPKVMEKTNTTAVMLKLEAPSFRPPLRRPKSKR